MLPASSSDRRAASARVAGLLRDLKAETVMRDIAAWTGDAQARLPSGGEKALPYAVAARAQPGKEGDGAAAPHALNCASPNRHARP